jgi:hypothetical protein
LKSQPENTVLKKETDTLNKQIKDMKTKVTLTENLISKKNTEIELLRGKLEKKLIEDEKWVIRDRATFERHFGRAPN